MKLNRLFEDVFMDIDWSLYDDETAELSELEDKIYRTASNAIAKWHPKTRDELVEAIKKELANGNTDLNCIDTSEITDMSWVFEPGHSGIRLSEEQQRTLDVSDWDVRNVKDMHGMFDGCTNFNQDLSKWKVSNVRDMGYMFLGCENFNQDLSGWDVKNVESMYGMFNGCTKFNQDLSKWDVWNVESVWSMFYGCTKLEKNGLIPDWFKHKLK